jgi:hypothetical protein
MKTEMPKTLWRKGQSGNPKGRPKKIFNFLNEVDAQMIEVAPNDERKRTKGQIVAGKMVELMMQGSIRAINEYLDRKLGKPPQAVAIADLRTENRDETIANILESLKAMRETSQESYGDGKQTIQ